MAHNPWGVPERLHPLGNRQPGARPGLCQNARTMTQPAKAYLHVGLPKTGTSFLQSHLWDSPTQLAAVGIRMVPDGRGETFTLMRAVRGQLEAEGKEGRATRAVEG